MRMPALVMALITAVVGQAQPVRTVEEPYRIGIVHALTGPLALTAKPLVDAEMLAIEEINASGGLLGRRIEPVLQDSKSELPTLFTLIDQFMFKDKIDTVICCTVAAQRRTVVPIFEHHKALLLYPGQYEGIEVSPNVLYAGPAPNQKLYPVVEWFMANRGTKFFIVASDAVYPRTASEILKAHIDYLHGEVAGEAYLPLGGNNFAPVVKAIQERKPTVILNLLTGDSNLAFFKMLREAGVTAQDIPTVSFNIGESALPAIGADLVVGDYIAWSYLDSIDSKENQDFLAAFQAKYGNDRRVDDPMQSAYVALKLWAQAVTQAGSFEPAKVIEALDDQHLSAPEGDVYVDAENHSLWRTPRIGRIRADGHTDIIWKAEAMVHPMPYPLYRTRADWDAFLNALHVEWELQWANPHQGTDQVIIK